MTVAEKIRTGVVGVGYLGQFHAEKYAGLGNVELAGIADPDLRRAEQIGTKLNARSYADASRLLGTVDAVSVVTPTVHHYATAKLFLESGVHVLLEKPMTVTLEQADDLIALAARKRVVLQIGHIERFNPAIAAVRPLLRAPRYLQAERSAPFTVRCTDVNVILDLMIHDLDIVSQLAGARPQAVSAMGSAVITGEIDAASARIVFENGCVADVAASRVSDEKKRLLRIFDGETVYTADYHSQKAYRSCRSGAAAPGLVSEEIPTERCDTLLEEIKAFLRSVALGVPPAVSGPEGRNALALAQLISRSIERRMTDFAAFEA